MVRIHVSAGQQGCEYVARDLYQSVGHGIRIQEVIYSQEYFKSRKASTVISNYQKGI